MLVENFGMFMGFVIIVCVMYQFVFLFYVYLVSGDWESDKDKSEQVKDVVLNCLDIGRDENGY